MYSKKELNAYYYKTKGFYIFFIPIAVPYKEIYQKAKSAGLKLTQEFGPIIEQGKMFGFGWIGVEIEKPTSSSDNVIQVKGQFEVLEHKGPYKTLGKAYKKIMKDHPQAKEYYNIYLDDPNVIIPEDCRTEVYFR